MEQNFMLLDTGGVTFGLPALLVRRVLDAEALMPLPTPQAFVRGVANVAGRVVCIITLEDLLGFADEVVEKPFWVIVDLPDGQLGLAVERVRQSPPGETVERLTRAPAGETALACTDYWAQVQDEVFRVLSLRALYDYMMQAVDAHGSVPAQGAR